MLTCFANRAAIAFCIRTERFDLFPISERCNRIVFSLGMGLYIYDLFKFIKIVIFMFHIDTVRNNKISPVTKLMFGNRLMVQSWQMMT